MSSSTDLYAFLNVSRDASPSEITAAYKRLSRLYHPDKHVDPEQKEKAQRLFSRLQTAYAVLIDEHQRAIYDALGSKGLKEKNWPLVKRTKTPREIREEYELLAKEQAERRLHQRTNPTSKLTLSLDASQAFAVDPYALEFPDVDDEDDEDDDEDYDLLDWLPHVEVLDVNLSQSVQFPLTSNDTAVLSGQVGAKASGNGAGGVALATRHVFDEHTWIEGDIGVNSSREKQLGMKLFRRITQKLFCNASLGLNIGDDVHPACELSFGQTLGDHTVGFLTYSSNWAVSQTIDTIMLTEEQSGVVAMVNYNKDNTRLAMSLQFGVPYTYALFKVVHKRENAPDRNLSSVLKVGTFGLICEYGVEEKVSEHSVLGATMVVGFPVGISLRIKVQRAQQTYYFPIKLADEFGWEPLFYGTVAPLLVWASIKKLIIEPYQSRRRASERERRREFLKDKIHERRREALHSVDLMRERYTRLCAEETAKQGLVVLKAFYGAFQPRDVLQLRSSSSSLLSSPLPLVVDVTVALQCQQGDDGRIELHDSISKSGLPGFYDPDPKEDDDDNNEVDDNLRHIEKHLWVSYRFRNILHEVLIADNEALTMPKMEHRVIATS